MSEISESFDLQRPELIKAILERRSVRTGFEDIDVPGDIAEDIVECGLSAPSSKNAQPWRLHVVNNQGTLTQIAKDVISAKGPGAEFIPHDPITGEPRLEYRDTVQESAHVLGNVPLGIFIENLGRFSVSREVVANAKINSYGAVFGFGLEYIGLGACIENMWLAAEAYGYRAVFMGDVAIAEESIKERLNISGDLVGVLAVGKATPTIQPKIIKEDRVIWH